MAWGALLFALLVATGAGYRLAYEKHIRSSRKYDPDRLVWLAYAAALFLAFLSWPIYEIYDEINPLEERTEAGNPLQHPSGWVWVSIPGLVAITWVFGHLMGWVRGHHLTSWPKARKRAQFYDSQTGFDFVMYSPLKRKSSATTILLVQLKAHGQDQGYYVVGYPRFASAAPRSPDIYLNPTFFYGTKDKLEAHRDSNEFKIQGYKFKTQRYGVLVRYDDISSIKVWESANGDLLAEGGP